MEQVIRQKLDVASRVLDLIPFALGVRAEIPEAVSPPALVSNWFEVFGEGASINDPLLPVSIRDCIHQEPEAHNAGSVHQS